MIYRALFVFLITFLIALKSVAGFAFDPQTDCAGFTVQVSTVGEIKTALVNASQKDGSYLVCFTSLNSIEINETIVITGKDKPFFVQGLSIVPKVTENLLTKIYEPFKSQLISVSGASITFQNLVINRAVDINNVEHFPTSALQIVGSNVQIVDSELHASQTGIAIGTAEKAADNISISGTKVAGNGSADSKGIAIVNSSSVSVSAASEIDNFAIGIDGKAMLDQVVFKIPNKDSIPIQNDGNKIDATKLAKRLDPSDEKKVTAIIGLSPVACSADATKGKVDLYIFDSMSKILSYQSACDIKTSAEFLCVVSDKDAAPATCTKETATYPVGSCIFECSVNFPDSQKLIWIRLGYKDQTGISNTLTDDLLVSDLGRISTGAFPVSVIAPGTENFAPVGGNETGISSEFETFIEDSTQPEASDKRGSSSGSEMGSDSTAGGKDPGAQEFGSSVGMKGVGCNLLRRP